MMFINSIRPRSKQHIRIFGSELIAQLKHGFQQNRMKRGFDVCGVSREILSIAKLLKHEKNSTTQIFYANERDLVTNQNI